MNKTEISIRLGLPLGKEQCERCKTRLRSLLEAQPELEQVMLFDDGEEERINLSFCYEEPVSLDAILDGIAAEGASVHQFFVQLPSSLTGVASAYDARDVGGAITDVLKSLAGVQEAALSSNGALRLQLEANAPDASLEKATNKLMKWKQERVRSKQ